MMRGSAEAVAVARDVASSSPSKNTSALDMMSRYQRISPDCLPVANGSGSGSSTPSRKPAAQEPRSSADVQDAPADSSSSARLASHLATVSLGQPKPPRAGALLPTPAYPPAGIVIRDHAHQPAVFAAYTAQTPIVIGGSSSSSVAAADGSVRLQWGHNKRSRGRREAPPLLPTPPPALALAPAPVPETPAQARRRASIKIHRRAAAAPAPAEKLMPPPSAPRGGPVIRLAPLPPRAAAVAAADALHGRVVAALSQHRSAAEPRAASPARQQHSRPQRQLTEKDKGKGPAVPEPPAPRQQPTEKDKGKGPAAEVQKLAARPEMPRIFTTLSRREKEEDFLAMKGTKLPVRPKKRTKAVEKQVSNICPGQWLAEVTRSRYMVREKRSKKEKRKGGLKAMDSDSD